jgi:molybdopterin/thiamine biosynthesis adenylyltransferase
MTEPERIDPVEALRIGQAVARDRFVDVLARAEFRRTAGPENRWQGALNFLPATGPTASQMTTVVDVVIPDEFPFQAPMVYPQSRAWTETTTGQVFGPEYHEAGKGWHRDGNQAMCLFVEADHTRLPWAVGEELLNQARAWLAEDAAGWPADQPALDLERYLKKTVDQGVILYGPLEGQHGQVFRLRKASNGVLRLGTIASPRRVAGRGTRPVYPTHSILVLDVGDLREPVGDWEGLCEALGPDSTALLSRMIAAGVWQLLLTYTRRGVQGTRRGVQGVLGVALAEEGRGEPGLVALRTAPDDLLTRSIRAHPAVGDLQAKRVAIVGVGAIGSVTADLLHRSGVGQMVLLDDDPVLPGNTTRHLLGERAVGLPKARAVAEHLQATRPHQGNVTWLPGRLQSLEKALELLGAHDVVVDASADSTATAMLTAAARAGAGQLLSVCVLADGYAVRVDRTPTRQGEEPLPPPELPPPGDAVYETGCGSPVSATPPAAVWEAAAVATRHTLHLLLDPASVPSGEERVLAPGGAP